MFSQPACPECFRYGQTIFEGSDHHPQCDGEEIWCHENCPVPVQYMGKCQTCDGTGSVTYEQLVAWVDARELDPLEKSELIESCMEAVC